MAALSWDVGTTPNVGTAVVDDVAYTLFNNEYYSLKAYQQQVIDRAGQRAFDNISAWGVYFESPAVPGAPETPSGPLLDAPGAWVSWLWAEAVAQAGIKRSDTSYTEIRREAATAKQTAIQTYDYVTSDDNTAEPITLQEVRRYCAISLSRRDSPPALKMVDWAAQWTLNHIWNMKNWNFRQRPATLAIATDSTVVVSDTLDLGSLNTGVLWYTDTAGLGTTIKWAGADDMAHARATITTTGRPTKFRVTKTADAWVWQFSPEPDIAYTVRTEVLIDGPPTITAERSEVPFAQYPTAFTPLILDMTLAKVELDMRMNGSQAHLDRVEAEVESLFPQYQSIGKPVQDGYSIRDRYGDFETLGLYGWAGG